MRALRVLLLVGLCLILPAAAWAQLPRIIGPGGILEYNTASVSLYNTTAEGILYNTSIPGAYAATAPAINTTTLWSTSAPLHLKMLGTVNTSAGNPVLSVGVNFGGSGATLTLLNSVLMPGNMANLPLQLDVWLSPIASFSATNITGNNVTVFLTARLTHQATGTIINPDSGRYSTPGATQVTFNASVLGTTRLASPVALNVLARWTVANGLNSIAIYQRILKQGN